MFSQSCQYFSFQLNHKYSCKYRIQQRTHCHAIYSCIDMAIVAKMYIFGKKISHLLFRYVSIYFILSVNSSRIRSIVKSNKTIVNNEVTSKDIGLTLFVILSHFKSKELVGTFNSVFERIERWQKLS